MCISKHDPLCHQHDCPINPSVVKVLLLSGLLFFTEGLFPPAHAQGSPDFGELIQARSKQLKSSAGLFYRGMQFAQQGAELYYLNSELSEITGCIEPGERVMVFLNYRSSTYNRGLRDILVEVSPHPFSHTYITTPGSTYKQKAMLVQGTGKYLSLGFPKYEGIREYQPLKPGETVMYARPLIPQQSIWRNYKEKLESWKKVNKKRIEAWERQPKFKPVRSDFIQLDKLKPNDLLFLPFQPIEQPSESEKQDIDERLRGLINDFQQLEQDVIDFEQTISTQSSRVNQNESYRLIDEHNQKLNQLTEALKIVLRTIDAYGYSQPYLSLLDGRGLTSRVPQPKTAELIIKARLMDMLRQRQNMRQQNAAQERKERPEVLKRRGWAYLKNAVDLACADPDRFERYYRYKKLPGVKFSAADFERFYAPDRARKTQVLDLLKVRRENRPLSACQRYILDRIQGIGRPVGVLWIIEQTRQYREENPGLLKRLVITANEASNAIDQFFKDLGESLTSPPDESYSPYDGSDGDDDYGQTSSNGDGNERGSGMSGQFGDIDFVKPDFDLGPGSTLGR